MGIYEGPTHLVQDVQTALCVLNGILPSRITTCESHSVINIVGFDHKVEVICGIAVYLVGAIASSISYNLEIRAKLFNDEELTSDLYRNVIDHIGPDNEILEHSRTHERDPWIWEGISHLLMHLSRQDKDKHPPGYILAKTYLHLRAKDPGLDVLVLYGPEPLGVSIGECKAYPDRANEAITDSASRLAEVDGAQRDAEIRQIVSQMGDTLSAQVQSQLTGAFWRHERAYFPMVCCDARSAVNWEGKREVLERLNRPNDRKFLVPAAIEKARVFFDHIADAMRAYANNKLDQFEREFHV